LTTFYKVYSFIYFDHIRTNIEGDIMKNDSNTEIVIDPSRAALLLLHWQNDIAAPGGKNSQDMVARLKASRTIEHTQAVLKATREKGMLVVYINAAHRPGYPEMSTKRAPMAKMLAELGVMIKGTWGAGVIDQLKPQDNDIIIDNYSSSGFSATDLDLILRNKGIIDIVLSGIATNMVVESTARDGFNMGYYVYTLEDCCKSITDEMHDWTIKNILSLIGCVIDSRTYINALKAQNL
jgi:nicotinamidase-related amidase